MSLSTSFVFGKFHPSQANPLAMSQHISNSDQCSEWIQVKLIPSSHQRMSKTHEIVKSYSSPPLVSRIWDRKGGGLNVQRECTHHITCIFSMVEWARRDLEWVIKKTKRGWEKNIRERRGIKQIFKMPGSSSHHFSVLLHSFLPSCRTRCSWCRVASEISGANHHHHHWTRGPEILAFLNNFYSFLLSEILPLGPLRRLEDSRRPISKSQFN